MNKHKFLLSALVTNLLLTLTAGAALAQGPTPPVPGKPVTGVTAGTGLTGGGASGVVTLAISNTYQLPQACANGQVAMWNGTKWACTNDGLTLAFVGSVNSNNDLLAITNTGTGRAGYFEVDNPTNTTNALAVKSNGATSALRVSAIGNETPAGGFVISNTLNAQHALYAFTNGIGNAFYARNTGTGRAGRFEVNNPTNSSRVLEVTTNGTGNVGYFRIDNPANASRALEVTTNGTGNAGSFKIDNPASNHHAIYAESNGTSNALRVYNFGTGWGGTIEISNTLNSNAALTAKTNGTGGAVDIQVSNPANANNALQVYTKGTGWLANLTTFSGKGIYISVPSGNEGLNVASGTKNAVVATSNGARLLYTEESSQVWFTDYGFGRLQNGSAFIAIDPLFAETINLNEPYHVFAQAYGNAEIFVTNRVRNGFEVKLRAGDPDIEFSYRLVAKRLGFENKRLQPAPWADSDPNLYPK